MDKLRSFYLLKNINLVFTEIDSLKYYRYEIFSFRNQKFEANNQFNLCLGVWSC